jgi:signal transduction histidine kinase
VARKAGFGSFFQDVVGIAVGLVLVPAAAILGLSLAMVGLVPPPGGWIFPLFLVPLGAALVAGGLLLLLASREQRRVAQNQALFVAQAGHELRTPLTTLRLLAQELGQRQELGPQAQQLEAAAQALTAGIERLLDWGRLASGRQSLRLEPLQLPEVVEEARRLVEPRLRQRGQKLVCRGVGSPVVCGHRSALVSALTNLLVNASKYSPPGTEIEVGIGQAGSWAEVWVRDQGPGLPAKEQRKVFRPFYRGEGVTAQGIEGFGLGLAIVAQVASAHGGRVEVRSQLGRGSTFSLRLPLGGGT